MHCKRLGSVGSESNSSMSGGNRNGLRFGLAMKSGGESARWPTNQRALLVVVNESAAVRCKRGAEGSGSSGNVAGSSRLSWRAQVWWAPVSGLGRPN